MRGSKIMRASKKRKRKTKKMKIRTIKIRKKMIMNSR